jgi:hypothetical protein
VALLDATASFLVDLRAKVQVVDHSAQVAAVAAKAPSHSGEEQPMTPEALVQQHQSCVPSEDCVNGDNCHGQAWCNTKADAPAGHRNKFFESCHDTATRTGANIPRKDVFFCDYGTEVPTQQVTAAEYTAVADAAISPVAPAAGILAGGAGSSTVPTTTATTPSFLSVTERVRLHQAVRDMDLLASRRAGASAAASAAAAAAASATARGAALQAYLDSNAAGFALDANAAKAVTSVLDDVSARVGTERAAVLAAHAFDDQTIGAAAATCLANAATADTDTRNMYEAAVSEAAKLEGEASTTKTAADAKAASTLSAKTGAESALAEALSAETSGNIRAVEEYDAAVKVASQAFAENTELYNAAEAKALAYLAQEKKDCATIQTSVATRAAAPTTGFLMISQMVNRLHAHTTDRVHGRYSYMAKDDTLSGQGGAKDALFAFIDDIRAQIAADLTALNANYDAAVRHAEDRAAEMRTAYGKVHAEVVSRTEAATAGAKAALDAANAKKTATDATFNAALVKRDSDAAVLDNAEKSEVSGKAALALAHTASLAEHSTMYANNLAIVDSKRDDALHYLSQETKTVDTIDSRLADLGKTYSFTTGTSTAYTAPVTTPVATAAPAAAVSATTPVTAPVTAPVATAAPAAAVSAGISTAIADTSAAAASVEAEASDVPAGYPMPGDYPAPPSTEVAVGAGAGATAGAGGVVFLEVGAVRAGMERRLFTEDRGQKRMTSSQSAALNELMGMAAQTKSLKYDPLAQNNNAVDSGFTEAHRTTINQVLTAVRAEITAAKLAVAATHTSDIEIIDEEKAESDGKALATKTAGEGVLAKAVSDAAAALAISAPALAAATTAKSAADAEQSGKASTHEGAVAAEAAEKTSSTLQTGVDTTAVDDFVAAAKAAALEEKTNDEAIKTKEDATLVEVEAALKSINFGAFVEEMASAHAGKTRYDAGKAQYMRADTRATSATTKETITALLNKIGTQIESERVRLETTQKTDTEENDKELVDADARADAARDADLARLAAMQTSKTAEFAQTKGTLDAAKNALVDATAAQATAAQAKTDADTLESNNKALYDADYVRAEELADTVFAEEKKIIDGKYASEDFLLDAQLSPLAALSTSIKSGSPVAETALAGAPTLFDGKDEYVTSHSTAYIEATGVVAGMAGTAPATATSLVEEGPSGPSGPSDPSDPAAPAAPAASTEETSAPVAAVVEDNRIGDYVDAVSAAATAEKAALATQKAGEYAAIAASRQALIDLATSKRASLVEGDKAVTQRALDTLVGADEVFGAASASQDTADTNHKAAGVELDEAQKAKVLWDPRVAEKALEAKAQNGKDHAAAAAKIAANKVAGDKYLVDEEGILATVRAAVAKLGAAATSTALVQMVSALVQQHTAGMGKRTTDMFGSFTATGAATFEDKVESSIVTAGVHHTYLGDRNTVKGLLDSTQARLATEVSDIKVTFDKDLAFLEKEHQDAQAEHAAALGVTLSALASAVATAEAAEKAAFDVMDADAATKATATETHATHAGLHTDALNAQSTSVAAALTEKTTDVGAARAEEALEKDLIAEQRALALKLIGDERVVLAEIRSFMHDKITSGALDNAPTATVAKCDAEQANAEAQKTAAVAALAACTQAKIDHPSKSKGEFALLAVCAKSDEANKASAAAASAYAVCAGGERGMLSLLESMAKKYLDATGNEIVTDKVGGEMGVTAALSMVDRLLDILTTEEATVAAMVTADTTTAESLRAGKVAAATEAHAAVVATHAGLVAASASALKAATEAATEATDALTLSTAAHSTAAGKLVAAKSANTEGTTRAHEKMAADNKSAEEHMDSHVALSRRLFDADDAHLKAELAAVSELLTEIVKLGLAGAETGSVINTAGGEVTQ